MRLNSARQMWHDAFYQPWDSGMSHVLEIGLLGASVQKTERGNTAGAAAHQALAGRVQMVISGLSSDMQAFGNYLYSPLATADDRDDAEALVFDWCVTRLAYQGKTLTDKRRHKLFYVSKLCLYRYRRLHQGGMSGGVDPLPTPEAFRKALEGVYGVKIRGENWSDREQPYLDLVNAVCSDIDKIVLGPLAKTLTVLLDAA